MLFNCFAAGSRTPHYGGMTPSHDGSRTPGAWDPSITNTPARSDPDNYSLDEFGAHPSTGPYTPQTPGGMYGSDQSYSPYQASPSPTGYHSQLFFFVQIVNSLVSHTKNYIKSKRDSIVFLNLR